MRYGARTIFQSGDYAVERFERDHECPLNLMEWRLTIAGFTPEQIQTIREISESVCHDCMENDAGCHCWNDE